MFPLHGSVLENENVENRRQNIDNSHRKTTQASWFQKGHRCCSPLVVRLPLPVYVMYFHCLEVAHDRSCSLFSVIDMLDLFSRIHNYAELAARTQPNLHDTRLALQDMHISTDDLNDYLDKICHIDPIPSYSVGPPKPIPEFQLVQFTPVPPQQHPPYIPSYLPPFPSNHSFIRNKLGMDDDSSDPSKLRRKTVLQSRQVENGLSSFIKNEAKLIKSNGLTDIVNYESAWRTRKPKLRA